LIKEGSVTSESEPTSLATSRVKRRYLFLFSDILLLTKQRRNLLAAAEDQRYGFKYQLALHKITAQAVPDSIATFVLKVSCSSDDQSQFLGCYILKKINGYRSFQI
jgi:hypothetical protein